MEWWFGPVTVAYRLLTTLLVVGFGLLAVAAVRVVPSVQVLPELLIALGAVLVAVGAAIGWHFQWLMFELGPEGSGDIPYPLPMAVGALGYLLLIVGFALAAIGVWRRARA